MLDKTQTDALRPHVVLTVRGEPFFYRVKSAFRVLCLFFPISSCISPCFVSYAYCIVHADCRMHRPRRNYAKHIASIMANDQKNNMLCWCVWVRRVDVVYFFFSSLACFANSNRKPTGLPVDKPMSQRKTSIKVFFPSISHIQHWNIHSKMVICCFCSCFVRVSTVLFALGSYMHEQWSTWKVCSRSRNIKLSISQHFDRLKIVGIFGVSSHTLFSFYFILSIPQLFNSFACIFPLHL